MTDDPVLRLLRRAGARPAAPRERSDRVRAAVEARWRAEVHAGRRRRLALSIAACAAAAALLVAVLGKGWRTPAPSSIGTGETIATALRVDGSVRGPSGRALRAGDRMTAGGTIATGPGGRAALELAGGAMARLDSGTQIVVASGPGIRLDRGAIYVDTGAPPGRPGRVVVRTEMGEVRDIGTQFEVRLRDSTLQVSVREGIARLTRADRQTEIGAGTRLLVASSAGMETTSLPAGGPDWDWVQAIAPGFDLEGKTLADYLGWLARETGWRVRFAEPSLARDKEGQILHGSIEGLRPGETPAAVLPTCGLRHHVIAGELVIERHERSLGGTR